MDLDRYRRASLATWDRMAPGWEGRRDQLAELTAETTAAMVDRLAAEPGETILELAAGTGDTGFAAAAILGDEGRLISSDFSPAMVETAARRAAELGIENAEFRVVDAERIDLADASVDGVLCRWGYMLMADPGRALEETRRVLRPGGRLVLAVWGDPGRNPWATVASRALTERGLLEPPAPGTPGIFALADTGLLRALLADAGFDTVEAEEVALEWTFADGDDYWTFLLEVAGALSAVLAELEDDAREQVRAQIEQDVAAYADGGEIRLPGLNVVATAS